MVVVLPRHRPVAALLAVWRAAWPGTPAMPIPLTPRGRRYTTRGVALQTHEYPSESTLRYLNVGATALPISTLGSHNADEATSCLAAVVSRVEKTPEITHSPVSCEEESAALHSSGHGRQQSMHIDSQANGCGSSPPGD